MRLELDFLLPHLDMQSGLGAAELLEDAAADASRQRGVESRNARGARNVSASCPGGRIMSRMAMIIVSLGSS